MKVLVVCIPQAGHLTPVLPLATAMVQAGDEVVFATAADMREPIEKTGARLRPAGSPIGDWFGRLGARTRGAPGDGLPPERIIHYFLPRLFGEIGADDMIDDVLATGRELEPDLVVFDQEAFAGALAAELLGVRSVHYLVGPILDPETLRLGQDALSPLWRSFDRDVLDFGGVYRDITLALCPPSLEQRSLPAGKLVHMRPTPLPTETATPQTPPVVYLTLGTIWANVDVIRTVLAALADEPVQVVVTTGALDPAELGAVPGNVRVEQFVPQESLLPQCSAVVHHCGGGTMFGALAHGLPQLALPQAADNFTNAETLAAAGAARTLMPREVTVDSVRSAVREVLDDNRYRGAATRIAGELAAMPSAAHVADSLRRTVTG